MSRKSKRRLYQANHLQKERRLRSDFSKLISEFMTPSWFRWLEAFGISAALMAMAFTIAGWWTTRQDLQLTRQALKQESIARSWAILAAPSSGNSGKIEALETLYRYDISLQGIDISCERMGGGWLENDQRCQRATYLEGLNLSGVETTSKKEAENKWKKTAILNSANLSGADLSNAKLSGANLIRAKLRGSQLNNVNLSSSNLIHSDLDGAEIVDSNLSQSTLINVSFRSVSIRKSNPVSYTHLTLPTIYSV